MLVVHAAWQEEDFYDVIPGPVTTDMSRAVVQSCPGGLGTRRSVDMLGGMRKEGAKDLNVSYADMAKDLRGKANTKGIAAGRFFGEETPRSVRGRIMAAKWNEAAPLQNRQALPLTNLYNKYKNMTLEEIKTQCSAERPGPKPREEATVGGMPGSGQTATRLAATGRTRRRTTSPTGLTPGAKRLDDSGSSTRLREMVEAADEMAELEKKLAEVVTDYKQKLLGMEDASWVEGAAKAVVEDELKEEKAARKKLEEQVKKLEQELEEQRRQRDGEKAAKEKLEEKVKEMEGQHLSVQEELKQKISDLNVVKGLAQRWQARGVTMTLKRD